MKYIKTSNTSEPKHLIIKLGALGDMVQASNAFLGIYNHFKTGLCLLTTPPYVEFAKRLGCFEKIYIDKRHGLKDLLNLMTQLRKGKFQTIIDLQQVDRTRLYRLLLKGSYQNWISFDCKYEHPQERWRHLFEVNHWINLPSVDLTILKEPLLSPLPQPYAVLVMGASNAHGGAKKWPQAYYAKVAQYLNGKGITPVIIGSNKDDFSIFKGFMNESNYVDLVGKLSLFQLISLGEKALFSLGNDTGPQLFLASAQCPTFTFFSQHNPPQKGGAWAFNMQLHKNIYRDRLEDISVDKVIKLITPYFSSNLSPN